MATTKKIKVVLTNAGSAWDSAAAYRLHDYIIVDNATMYICKRVDPDTMVNVGHPLTDTTWWDKSVDLSKVENAAQSAADAANASAAKANASTSAADTATANAKTATDAANAAAALVTSATEKCETATSNAESATGKATDAVADVKALLSAFSSTNPFCGFARVAGTSDPAPADEYIYGSRSLVREIGSHIKLGTVKRMDGEAVLQHECAKGRITLASNGDAVAVDGSEGDLLLYTDIPLYLLKANETVGTDEMSCMGVGVIPCYWQNHAAKAIEPFAFSPFYTVQAKLDGDERTCAHNIINDNVNGTYYSPDGLSKEAFKPNGGGYPHQFVSALDAIRNAQNKNEDSKTCYPYMGAYYEFYELLVALMYAECGTLNTTNIYSMGVGCTPEDTANADTWNNEQIAANSGVKVISADGSYINYSNFMSQNIKKGESGSAHCNIQTMVGSCYYSMTKCGETISLLDGITKAGLTDKIGSNANIFYYDENGEVVCSSDGSINVDTGEGMEGAKRYYIVRNVPNCEGIADGVMTAVANCYVKMNFTDDAYWGKQSMAGGVSIWKFSHAVYRGLSMPMDGLLEQLCGAHYLSGKEGDAYYEKFYWTSKWQDVQPLTDTTDYGVKGTEFNILKGLTNVCDVPGTGAWAKKADYSKSLFCFTDFSGGSHTHEVAYTWNSHHCYGRGESNYPADGYECVKALAVGCYAIYSDASARTAICNNAASIGNSYCAGAFAVPQLKLKQ